MGLERVNVDQLIKSMGFFTKSRIEGLTDAVSAIAMTLLVLDLHVPTLGDISRAGGLPLALAALWPKYLTYGISFVMLGVFWVSHHGIFHLIQRSDRMLLWINIFYLMCLSSIPFSTALVSEYRHESGALVVYGCTMIVTTLALYAQWRHATRGHRLVDPDLPPRVVAYAASRLRAGLLIYLAAVATAFVNPHAALFVLLAIPILNVFYDQIHGILTGRRGGTGVQ